VISAIRVGGSPFTNIFRINPCLLCAWLMRVSTCRHGGSAARGHAGCDYTAGSHVSAGLPVFCEAAPGWWPGSRSAGDPAHAGCGLSVAVRLACRCGRHPDCRRRCPDSRVAAAAGQAGLPCRAGAPEYPRTAGFHCRGVQGYCFVFNLFRRTAVHGCHGRLAAEPDPDLHRTVYLILHLMIFLQYRSANHGY